MPTNTLLKVEGTAWSVEKPIEEALKGKTNSEDIITSLGLDYTVSAHHVKTDIEEPVPGFYGMYRDDSNTFLGIVKSANPIITQNVDNLHERAGSSQVIHLHGELSKVCSMDNRTTCVKEYPLTTPIMVGDKADDGSQLRPYIVMFGEYVDSMNVAIKYVSYADIFVVIGTSLQVYPAAGFINYAHHEVPKFVIDPGEMDQCTDLGFTHFKTTATEGMKMLLEAFKEL